MPEKVLNKLKSYVLPEWKACFFSALIVGLMAHLYKITSWLPNWDSIVFRYDPQNMLALGRWFLPVVCSFSSFYDLPFLNGIIAIVFHALAAVCICKMFNIKKKITAFLIGAVTVSFPTVTSVMMYNYVADGYSIAFFLSVLAAYFMIKEKPCYILSIICIALSTGIYQAYITVTIMLLLLKLIEDIVHNDSSFLKVLKKGGLMLLSGILGMALYTVILKVLLAVFSSELLDYQGINSTASLSNIDILSSLYIVKETFIKCFFDFSEGINLFVVLNIFILVVSVIFYIECIIKNKVYKKPATFISLLVLCVISLVGAASLAFINPQIDYHNLMLMGYLVFYLFFIFLYERENLENKIFPNIKLWVILITSLLVIANQVVIANVSYHKAQMAYEKSYGVLIRIADRIEQTDGAEECEKLLVIGALKNSQDYSVNLTPDITGITDGYILRADDETVNQSVLCSALSDYCEKDYLFVSGEEKKAMLEREDVKAMGTWPKEDSVALIDNTLVIKLGEN